MKIEIEIPEPPQGTEIWTGEGVPPAPYYGLWSLQWGWQYPAPASGAALAYAVPIARPKPKSRVVWVNVYSEKAGLYTYTTKREANNDSTEDRTSCQRITLYEGRFDQEGVPTPEERLIEAVGEICLYGGVPNNGSHPSYTKTYNAYLEYQEMKGETL